MPLPAGGRVPPDLPTPAPLPVVRLPEPADRTKTEGGERKRDPHSHGELNPTKVILVLAALVAAAGLAVWLLR